MTSGLVVDAMTVRAGAATLVDGVSLAARPGRVTGLIGPNGAGKSTLMRAALGLTAMEAGRVTFDGMDLIAMPRRTRAQLSALVEQTGATEAQLTAREVVALGRIPYQSVWQSDVSPSDNAVVNEALQAVAMDELANRNYQTLSGGEQQRLHIARALAQVPRLLVLDEPTNHLDVHAQLAILGLLRNRAAAGATVLLALHDLNLAAAFCDDLVVMDKGRLIAEGVPGQVLTPALLRAVYQVEATLLVHPKTGRPMIAYDLPA